MHDTHHACETKRRADMVALPFSSPTLFPPPSMFTPESLETSRHASKLHPSDALYNQFNISPPHTRAHDPQPTSPPSASTSNPAPTNEQLSTRPRRKASKRNYAPPSPSPPPRRRGTSSVVEPPADSARADYLLKNRQAASKCRNKQKMQQEELVETARNSERRNKALRGEVERLKEDVRMLMHFAGLHAGCADQRLRIYLERKRKIVRDGRIGEADLQI